MTMESTCQTFHENSHEIVCPNPSKNEKKSIYFSEVDFFRRKTVFF